MAESLGPGVAAAHGLLLDLLVDAPALDAFLGQIAQLATTVVTPPAACGLTMRRDGQPFTVVSSNDLAAQVDEVQYGADQGPCLDALRDSVIVQVDDLTQEDRWDRYRPYAIAHGVVSSLSMPLIIDGETVAALNLYSDQPAAFAGAERRHAEAFTAQCAAALALILRQVEQSQVQQQLTEAIASRSIIDQAIGILMAQQRHNAAAAFGLLREVSQHRNRKLREVAADIITHVTGEPPLPPTDFETGGARNEGPGRD
jgi:GAF domain-containing protein